jgi:hypothetical protein
MITIGSRHNKEYMQRELDQNTFLEKLYNTFKILYHSKDNTITLNELKRKDLISVVPDLEDMCAITSEPEHISVIDDSKVKKLRIYHLTKEGKHFYEEVEEHNKKCGYTTFEEMKEDFKLSLNIDYKGLIKLDVIDLRTKLKEIKENRKEQGKPY